MTLPAAVETFTIKNAQIYKKKLEIEQLQQAMADALVAPQEQITAIQADYSGQIASKNEEIAVLEQAIRDLVV